MKRTNQLIKQIIDSDNMRLAWLQTIRGKRDKRSVLLFREHLNDNLVMMAQQLEQGRYPWGHFCRFTIYDPKERQISVAPLRDRIAYHAIINVCEPVFERYQIDQSCACRKGRGQSEALRLATMYSRRNEWFLKLDIRKYFDSISHRYLKEQLLRLFKDTFVVKAFFDLIDSYEANIPDFGLPIGSLTSQFFANHYLGVMDHYIKETLHVRSSGPTPPSRRSSR